MSFLPLEAILTQLIILIRFCGQHHHVTHGEYTVYEVGLVYILSGCCVNLFILLGSESGGLDDIKAMPC